MLIFLLLAPLSLASIFISSFKLITSYHLSMHITGLHLKIITKAIWLPFFFLPFCMLCSHHMLKKASWGKAFYCQVFLEAAGKKDWIFEHIGPFWVYLFRQYWFISQYIDRSKILVMVRILALCTSSATMLMNPQDEILRYESVYVLYRKVHFFIQIGEKEIKPLIYWLILDSFL